MQDLQGVQRHILSFKSFMTIHEKLAHKIYDASTVRLIESKLQKFREKAGKGKVHSMD